LNARIQRGIEIPTVVLNLVLIHAVERSERAPRHTVHAEPGQLSASHLPA